MGSVNNPRREKRAPLRYSPNQSRNSTNPIQKLAFLGQDNTFTYEYAALFNDPGGSLGVTTSNVVAVNSLSFSNSRVI